MASAMPPLDRNTIRVLFTIRIILGYYCKKCPKNLQARTFSPLFVDYQAIGYTMLRFTFTICWAICSTLGFGQIKPAQSPFTLQDTAKYAVSPKVYSLLTFPNLNQIPYYYHKKQFATLQKQAEKSTTETFYSQLFPYVQNFGVANFIKDNHLLWKLAQLEEQQGDTTAAIAIYKLVLKHYTQEMEAQQARQRLDGFDIEKKEDYVPLTYYYELVEYRKEIDTLRPPRGVYLNMGDGINSPSGDYGPTLSAGNDALLFTSKRNKRQQGLKEVDNEDLMISYHQDGDWSVAEPLEGINSPYNEGSACLSPDGNTLFFARCNSPDGSGSCDLYVSSRQEQRWSTPQNLGKHINSSSWDSHPSLSRTGDTLFFASDRLGGFGLSDIYYTHKDARGQWVRPKNIGPVVNTRSSEVSPFFHPEHNVLYFSSDGHLLNFGEFDIYKSYRYRNIWNEPKNIGPLVNGQGSEFYFTIDAQSQNLYYARSVENKMANLDLYSFPLPMEAKPTATTNLQGSLVNSETGEPFSSGIVSIIDLDHGVEVAPKFLRQDGTFEFKLINNNNYLIIIQGEEFFRLEEVFFLTGDKTFNFETMPISSRIQFNNMEFDNGKADLKSGMFDDLDKIINFLMDNPAIQLHIEGHTDSDGNPELNRKLSQARADAIRAYLIDFGKVDATRVQATGYGSSKPIVEEKTAADKKLNRRVEFKIEKK